MLGADILRDNWEDYDNLKIKESRNHFHFSCNEPWEVTYLATKIKKIYPDVLLSHIQEAIAHCCHSVPPPRPRVEFVNGVMTRLKEKRK